MTKNRIPNVVIDVSIRIYKTLRPGLGVSLEMFAQLAERLIESGAVKLEFYSDRFSPLLKTPIQTVVVKQRQGQSVFESRHIDKPTRYGFSQLLTNQAVNRCPGPIKHGPQ